MTTDNQKIVALTFRIPEKMLSRLDEATWPVDISPEVAALNEHVSKTRCCMMAG